MFLWFTAIEPACKSRRPPRSRSTVKELQLSWSWRTEAGGGARLRSSLPGSSRHRSQRQRSSRISTREARPQARGKVRVCVRACENARGGSRVQARGAKLAGPWCGPHTCESHLERHANDCSAWQPACASGTGNMWSQSTQLWRYWQPVSSPTPLPLCAPRRLHRWRRGLEHLVIVQRNLRKRESEEDQVVRVRLHGHRVAHLRRAQLPRSVCRSQGKGEGGVRGARPAAAAS
ncbi:hypothetical protein Z043_113169 [Scleropages formosus]|uniref:Uncharacterized protein n=1 Tax=Scleropages formosus TaxID=113540 RepID=A0A0P7UEJ5_SCLFO|nr:hypothetical protein Z043_113169 [Scleropages formosus]